MSRLVGVEIKEVVALSAYEIVRRAWTATCYADGLGERIELLTASLLEINERLATTNLDGIVINGVNAVDAQPNAQE